MATEKDWIVKKATCADNGGLRLSGVNLNYREGEPGREFHWYLSGQALVSDRYDLTGCEWGPGALKRYQLHVTPIGYKVTEYWGKGDPMFGGSADDRPLCVCGQFKPSGTYRLSDVAIIKTQEAAKAAADAATKRPGGLVSITPVWRD